MKLGSFTHWIEISISGFFYLLALFFITLKVLDFEDLTLLHDVGDFLTLISIGIGFASYVLGILAHRLLSIVLFKPYYFIKSKIRKKPTRDNKDEKARHDANLVRAWQYGSARVHNELDAQFSLTSLFRSLMAGVPLSGISISVWMWGTNAQHHVALILTLSFLLGIAFYFVYKIQRAHARKIEQNIFDEINKIAKERKS
jgi:hypothetical protein